MQMIADGKIKDGTRIIHDDEEYLYDKRFNTLGIVGGHEDITEMLTFNELLNDDFEILEDTTEEIKPIDKSYGIFGFNEESFAEMKEMVQDIYEKTEELVIAYNKLNNTTYKAENCMTD